MKKRVCGENNIEVKRLRYMYPCSHLKVNGLEERISELGDDILVLILSRLATKEAARTSLLSHRWKHLWTLVKCLDLDESPLPYTRDKPNISKRRSLYVASINRALKSHQASTIEEFKLGFDLGLRYKQNINQWIIFALKRRVQRLHLNFSKYGVIRPNRVYIFPNPTRLGFSSFNSLKTLFLKAIDVSGEVIDYFLSNCPLIECLSVHFSETLVNLNIVGPSLNLKCLEIVSCFHLEKFEFSAPNLKSFKFRGQRMHLCFKNVPSLIEADFGGAYSRLFLEDLPQVSAWLPRLEKLTLNLHGEMSGIPVLHHLHGLKQLKLELCVGRDGPKGLMGLTSFLKVFPNLYRIAFQFTRYSCSLDCGWMLHVVDPFVHEHLKEVEYVGFVGSESDEDLITYLIDNATSLQKITIDTRPPHDFCWTRHSSHKPTARECALQLQKTLGKETISFSITG